MTTNRRFSSLSHLWKTARTALAPQGRRRRSRRFASPAVQMSLAPTVSQLEQRTLLAAAFLEFVDPNPHSGNDFGADVVPLTNGNVVVTSPGDDAGGTGAGAVYLFDGATGDLISTLIGSRTGDNVGINGVTALSTGNFVVVSSTWSHGRGAVTFGNGETGVSGPVSSANSLVGTDTSDAVGMYGVTALDNGNYVVASPNWSNGSTEYAGAVTLGSGTTGIVGSVSAANSLVGTSELDRVGIAGVRLLGNGNFVVPSPDWDHGAVQNAGAVTFVDGSVGISGPISPANSLVGSTANDVVGAALNQRNDVVVLGNGNYVVVSPGWDNGAVENAGAITFGSGSTGITGTISAANSLVGTSAFDQLGGGGVEILSNNNYVVSSPGWNGDTAEDAGAVTFGRGTTGVVGLVSPANSLVGTSRGDRVGEGHVFGASSGVTPLANGNYVVSSPKWKNGTIRGAGAVTLGNGSTGTTGVVSDSNSLVGRHQDDAVGNGGVFALGNGNFIVSTPTWDNETIRDAGAVTFVNGSTGLTDLVSSSNSLVGSTEQDSIGSSQGTVGGGITVLSNGNYVVTSPLWDNGTAVDAGAATFGNGTTGISGPVTASNSLVGTTTRDHVGLGHIFGPFTGVTPLTNGDYVVSSPDWDRETIENAGAATFGNGTTGVTGPVSPSNSLVGSTTGDAVGADYDTSDSDGVTPLKNGNYVVSNTRWDNAALQDAAAITFGNASARGVTGEVSANNSLIGTRAFELTGSTVEPLANGDYLVMNQGWRNADDVSVGAVTFGDGTTGVSGSVSAANSLVGSTDRDLLGNGGVTTFANGNYIVRSVSWNHTTTANPRGAVTFGNGTSILGPLTTDNSAIGLGDGQAIVVDDTNDTFFFSRFLLEENVGRVRVGSQITGFSGPIAEVNLSVSSNSGNETDQAVITVTATAEFAVSGDQSVDLVVTGTAGFNSDDYELSATSIVIPNGQTTGSVTFTIADDGAVERVETATLTMSAPSSGIRLGPDMSQQIVIGEPVVPVFRPPATTKTQDGRFEVEWTSANGADRYEIWYTRVTTGEAAFVHSFTETLFFQPAESLPIGRYRIWVRGHDSDGPVSAWSEAISVDVTTAPAIESPEFHQITTRPTLRWNTVPGAARYDLWVNNVTTQQSRVIRRTDLTDNVYTAAENLGFGEHIVWVRAIDAAGQPGAWSEASRFSVEPQPISPNVSTFEQRPTLEWTTQPGDVTYEVYVLDADGKVIQEAGLTSESWTPTADLPAGRTAWWIRPTLAGNRTASWSRRHEFFVGGRTQLTAPIGVAQHRSPLFEWSPVDGADRYEVYLQKLDDGSIMRQTFVGQTSGTFSTALAAGDYRIWVLAISDISGRGFWSPPAAMTIV